MIKHTNTSKTKIAIFLEKDGSKNQHNYKCGRCLSKKLPFTCFLIFLNSYTKQNLITKNSPNFRENHIHVYPPSTGNTTPVIKDASSLNKKHTARAISSGCPSLPIG